jgi:hypothetical protein
MASVPAPAGKPAPKVAWWRVALLVAALVLCAVTVFLLSRLVTPSERVLQLLSTDPSNILTTIALYPNRRGALDLGGYNPDELIGDAERMCLMTDIFSLWREGDTAAALEQHLNETLTVSINDQEIPRTEMSITFDGLLADRVANGQPQSLGSVGSRMIVCYRTGKFPLGEYRGVFRFSNLGGQTGAVNYQFVIRANQP